jgi:cytochrome bd-type quinol oxidase subunit 2
MEETGKATAFKVVYLAGICLVFGLSMINARDEGFDLYWMGLLSLLAVLAPLITARWALKARDHEPQPVLSRVCAFIVLGVGVAAYTYYASNGRANPDTAAHMHVVTFPILYLILALAVMGLSTALGHVRWWMHRESSETDAA